MEDLKWAWRTLLSTLYDAYRAGAVDLSSDPYWSPYVSTMMCVLRDSLLLPSWVWTLPSFLLC